MALELMGVKVEVVGEEFSLGAKEKPCPTMVYAPITFTNDRPSAIVLRVSITESCEEHRVVLQVTGGRASEIKKEDSSYLLRVPIRWEGEFPHTRVKGQDNDDIIFLYPDGSFRDMQISVSTNKGCFYANIQRVYAGWVVRTRGARIGERRFTFAPSDVTHAYPESNYGDVWDEMAEELIEWAIDGGSSVQLSRVKPAKWIQPELPVLDKWRRGEVFFWNMVTQTGLVRDLDTGGKLAVRYHSFANKPGILPTLCPMTAMRVWIMLSRSRTVTVLSSSVW